MIHLSHLGTYRAQFASGLKNEKSPQAIGVTVLQVPRITEQGDEFGLVMQLLDL